MVFERLPMMNILVAGTTDHQGFAMACGHRFDPSWFFWSPISLEVFECSDVVNLNVCV
jgi:hypothetical protein